MKLRLLSTISACLLPVIFCSAASAALLGRLQTASGDFLAYYDEDLKITWTANANINGSADTWENQLAWADSLTLGGVSTWRLPNMDVNDDGTVVDCFGGGVADCSDNEMGFLYWEEGITAADPGPFSDIQSNRYWSSTDYALIADAAHCFRFGGGVNCTDNKDQNPGFAWAVTDGDVPAVVPVPAALPLLGSALFGLLFVARRRRSLA